MDFSYTTHKTTLMAPILLLLVLFMPALQITGAQSVGVCYGRNGAALPSDREVVDLYKSNGIGRMRIFEPNQATLEALRGSNIELVVTILNNNLQQLTDAAAATNWVQKNVQPYSADVKFKYIVVGSEVHPDAAEAQYLLPVIRNIQNAVKAANLQSRIKVSTAIDTTLLGVSYPPSAGAFSDAANSFITPIITFLRDNGAPLLVNIYPYFAYIGDPAHVTLEYALFTSPGVVVHDGSNGYQNVFDALLDAHYSALEKVGAPNMNLVVSESGWPSQGGNGARIGSAGTYYSNLIKHVKTGTPKRPNGGIETYLFAMFDENLKKGAEIEKNFGIFSPNKQPKYQLTFR